MGRANSEEMGMMETGRMRCGERIHLWYILMKRCLIIGRKGKHEIPLYKSFFFFLVGGGGLSSPGEMSDYISHQICLIYYCQCFINLNILLINLLLKSGGNS